MRALVTGAAGFIGSHLADRLAGDGWDVIGIDALTPYYDIAQKQSNLAEVSETSRVSVITEDLALVDLDALLADVDVVFHHAAQPGVRSSWGDFDAYVAANIMITHRLLEAVRSTRIARFVYASSSSVYGNALAYPTDEDTLPRPQSPYGVTKLAAEHLCGVYARNFGVPTISLRYFTVFGPRQRPDMAMHRLVEAALTGDSFPIFGTGDQLRDFTFVADVVAANVAAATVDVPGGSVFNIAGGGSTSLNEVVEAVERITGRAILLDRREAQAGDVDRTGGSIDRARSVLGWRPRVSVVDGLEEQVQWHERRRRRS